MMKNPLLAAVNVFGSLLAFAVGAGAQEFSLEELLPGLKERAVVLDIVARVVEKNQEEVWNSANSKITIPGRPVGLKLVGANIVIAVQFTPYLRENGVNMLVAQGQIWIDVPNEGIRYQTTLQTIPLEFGELIYFFPLGSVSAEKAGGEARIEIQIQMHPYAAAVSPAPPEEPVPQPLPESETGISPKKPAS
ncbi:MAG: hypothetical protein LBG87_00175 [Spirochaetaceae bacterium]|jgi:uncharacterized membrane protein|nr:hypothetical protein [Spirochaetaceae bacterium]